MRIGLPVLLLLLAASAAGGCRHYTGTVKTEFLNQREIDEEILVDRIVVRVLNRPTPARPEYLLKIEWQFKREYNVLKTHSRSLEYFDYDPAAEILEVLASPFMLALTVPACLVLAPVELIAGGFEEAEKEYLFVRLSRMPFVFLHPALNADTWVNRKNVYGKTPKFEDAGQVEDTSPRMTEAFDAAAAGAELNVAVEGLEAQAVSADPEGCALIPITGKLAELSQDGLGLKMKVAIRFRDKTAEIELELDQATLETLYEALRLG